MPQIPVSQGPQLRDAPLGGVALRAPNVTAGLRPLAAGLDAAEGLADKAVQRNDQDVAFATEARIKTEFAAFDADLRKNSQGRNAAGFADKVNQWWTEQSQAAAGALTNSQRALVARSLQAAQVQAQQAALRHQDGELERSAAESFAASQLAEIQRAAASGDPAVALVSSQLIRERNAQQGQRRGWTPEQLTDANTRLTTQLHANVVQHMQQRDPTAALAYFNANKAEIDGTRHAEIERSLTVAAAANDGDQAASGIWAALGPKGLNDPVALDQMAEQARKRFPNDPVRRKAATDALRERATLHNASQAEANAGATNQVMEAYNQSRNLAAVKRSPAWGALPAQKQTEIEHFINNARNVELQRANAADARVDAAEARAQRKLARDGFASYLALSEPSALAQMSDAQVQALLPTLGNELTNHLIEKKRRVTANPPGEAEAKIDKQDFDHIAETMGLKPFAKKSEEEKAQLGELQYRVEQMLYRTQQAKGKALTRQEKTDLMQRELARTVKVRGFFSDTEKSVLQLTKDDIADVIVPPADRKQIVEAMKTMFDKTQNPSFAPTEANLKRFFLLDQSRDAASLLPFDAAR